MTTNLFFHHRPDTRYLVTITPEQLFNSSETEYSKLQQNIGRSALYFDEYAGENGCFYYDPRENEPMDAEPSWY